MRALIVAGLLWLGAGGALADAVQISHGISTRGALKYPPDFKHFGWVNPDAPKGGQLSTIGAAAINGFDSLNGFVLKGDPAQGLQTLYFDSLMIRSWDEPDAVYGLLARHVEMPESRAWAIFELRPEARFADGSPVTAEDVVFSINSLRDKGAPLYALALRGVTSVRALSAHRVRFDFAPEAGRNLVQTVATMPVFSAKWYAGRDFAESSMDVPLSSGPYAIEQAIPNSVITYRRRADWWAAHLPVARGRWNFDQITYRYYKDRALGFEAFKAGDYLLREEFTSKTWATEYEFPAVKDGRVKRITLPDGRMSGTQGFWLNTRRPQLVDVRVREALAMMFDFEWSNRSLFYGLYTRTDSFFENSVYEAVGEPSAAELALLEPYRGRLDPRVFGPAVSPPVTDGTGNIRDLLRRAGALLDASGWKVVDGKRRNAAGQVLSVEILDSDDSFGRIIQPYLRNLERLGVEATFRVVDDAQLQRRQEAFDYDMLPARFSLSATPGTELRAFLHSQSAQAPGSQNLAGIADPVIDALLERALAARDDASAQTALRALDRIFRAGHYWVPHWFKASHHIAMWDRFERPSVKPPFDRAIEETWWARPAGTAGH